MLTGFNQYGKNTELDEGDANFLEAIK